MDGWRVLAEHGVLVREEASLSSPESGRVSCGALLLQQDLQGDRLGFQLLRGSGPLKGYVSVKVKGKELLQRCRLHAPETEIPRVSDQVSMPKVCMTTWSPLRRVANFRPILALNMRPRLYRSGHLAAASPEDLKYLESLGLRTYIDLRDGVDFEGADAEAYAIFPPSPKSKLPAPASGRRRVSCPFSKDLKMRPWTAEEKMGTVREHDRKAWTSWWYQRLIRMKMEKKVDLNLPSELCSLNRAILFINADEVLKAMQTLTEEENYPIVFGCVAGKDRTGLLACLVLSALGMDKETIMRDYLTTNEAAEHINACAQVGMGLYWKQVEVEDPRKFQMMVRNGQVGPLKYDISWPGPTGDGAGALPAVYPATMNYTLELLEEQGGALKYLESIGFGPADVRRLRERLLEDPTAGPS